jgi:FdhD protein
MKMVADQFAETLAAADVKRVYGNDGDSLNELIEALLRQGRIERVHVLHEDVAAIADLHSHQLLSLSRQGQSLPEVAAPTAFPKLQERHVRPNSRPLASSTRPLPPSDELTLASSSTQKRKVRRRSEIATCFRLDGWDVSPRDAAIAAEVPVALAYNGLPHVVMMSTPSDLTDFAVGFSISEGILADAKELLDVEVQEGETGIRVSMTIVPERFADLQKRRRNMTGRTGCGLCGVDDLTQVARPLPRVGKGLGVDIAAIHRALAALPAWQLANQETGAVHAAAWATPAGEIAFAREDVGRHNALDKLIGAMARNRIDPETGFAVITSRCSFEMVQKAATIGIPILVAISAPTTMALRIAEQTGVTLVALARSDSVTVFANPGRIEEIMTWPN